MAIHSQRKFDYYTAAWSIVHRDDEVPAEGTLLFVNRSPSRLIPKGRGRPCTAGQLFTVTMHSHAAEVRVYTPGQSFTPTMRSQPRIEYTAGLSFNGFCVLIVYHADVVVCCNDMQACVTMRNSNKKCELTPKVLQ